LRFSGADEGSGHEQLLVDARIVRGVKRTLGDGYIAGFLDEFRELRVGDLMTVDRKAVDPNTVDRGFLPIEVL
jgi:hypothetical protein